MPHSITTDSETSNGSTPARRGVYLLTHPRSASNLFQTMMAKQRSQGADVQSSGYHFFDACFPLICQMDKGSISGCTEAERETLYDPYKAAFEKLTNEMANAEKEGHQVFIKEHVFMLTSPDELFAYGFGEDNPREVPFVLRREGDSKAAITHTNPTFLPDEVLLAMQPVFQIRHPVLMFPSLVRAQGKVLPNSRPSVPRLVVTLTLRGSRALFDWYLKHPAALSPKVIDADDIMKDREAVRQLCREIDFDPDAVQYEWETREEKDPAKAAFLSTIAASTGIKPGLEARCVDLEAEKVKWVEEFGEVDGRDLAKAVEAAMPDYEYLLSHRVRSS